MPRIYDGYNDPWDFCKKCFPSETEAKPVFKPGNGPDNRGSCYEYDASHPSYDEVEYRCTKCKRPLTEADN